MLSVHQGTAVSQQFLQRCQSHDKHNIPPEHHITNIVHQRQMLHFTTNYGSVSERIAHYSLFNASAHTRGSRLSCCVVVTCSDASGLVFVLFCFFCFRSRDFDSDSIVTAAVVDLSWREQHKNDGKLRQRIESETRTLVTVNMLNFFMHNTKLVWKQRATILVPAAHRPRCVITNCLTANPDLCWPPVHQATSSCTCTDLTGHTCDSNKLVRLKTTLSHFN